MERSTPDLSATFVRGLYARMLLTRIVDERAWRLHEWGDYDFITTCRGHEAAQIGSAICIEVGKDFTLPYYRDLGVVLTIGMTPYEVFRTYVQTRIKPESGNIDTDVTHDIYTYSKDVQPISHWGYHKHNMVTGSVPAATHILHAAGIAFACKLRKATAVTVAYCGDDATNEPDFLEGITFAAQHRLPVVFICEQNSLSSSLSETLSLPTHLKYTLVDGTEVIAVYSAMKAAMQHAREGHGPVLLEMRVRRLEADRDKVFGENEDEAKQDDPLVRYQQYLEDRGMWDEVWASELHIRLEGEVEQAMGDALRDGL